MPDNLNLVILAAGLGSRFGGPKQLEPVGPNDETILDYTVFDARRAGFKRVIFVIRQAMIRGFHPWASRARDAMEVHIALQHLEDAPKDVNLAARTRPWGTAHALLTAAPHVSGAFAVCNADDFYGAEAFRAAVGFLSSAQAARTTWALVGYPLRSTLSPDGPVNRAVCRVDDQGWLQGLEERSVSADDPGSGLVSMNFWCFTQELFGRLQSGFEAFAFAAGPEAEYLLPNVVRDALAEGGARIKVLDPRSRWFGLTHPGDLVRVRAAVRDEIARGTYPPQLWP